MADQRSQHDSDLTRTVIVGGSLGGLSTALALAATGRASTVLEQTSGRTQRGVAILVSGASLARALGPQARAIVGRALGPASMRQGVYPHAWWDVYSALRSAADVDDLITIVEDARVVEVGQDADAAWARTDDGRDWRAELVLGADGYRSVVRRYVDEQRPTAQYAGYVVWLGQSDVPPAYLDRLGGPNFFAEGDDMLAVYPLIERDESVPRYGWGWFDPNHTSLFRAIGAVDGHEVKYTPRPTSIPDEVFDEMRVLADDRWDEPWRTGVVEAFETHDVVPTPITEYLPSRVVNGRIGLLGDAAHAQTPMTGAGFEEAVTDARGDRHVVDRRRCRDGPGTLRDLTVARNAATGGRRTGVQPVVRRLRVGAALSASQRRASQRRATKSATAAKPSVCAGCVGICMNPCGALAKARYSTVTPADANASASEEDST